MPYLVSPCLIGFALHLSLSFPSGVGVDDRLFCIIDQTDMDPQAVIVDQFTTTVASIQEVINSLNQKPDSQ